MHHRSLPLIAMAALLAGCSMAPAYHVPTSVTPTASFRVDPGWAAAAPADAVAKGEWWRLFGDDTLNTLEARVLVTNQNLAYYRAAYAQALATVRVDRAALLPTIGASASVTRQGTVSGRTMPQNLGTTGASTATSVALDGTASWTPDLWGSLSNTARGARATAEASAAQLANATLSAQGTLATTYFTLRGIDAQAAALDEDIVALDRALAVTRNKFTAGTATAADVASAEITLANARANRRDLERQRVANETAIAVLVGENPGTFALKPAEWHPVVPDVPQVVPSQVLERRPDVAGAERQVAAANAQIGVQRAAFFPTVSLSAQLGSNASSLSSLFGAATSLWSLGASAAETLIDWGARSARVAGARAAYDQAVATYRQTVLGAFQEVESDLAAVAAYRAEADHYHLLRQSADNAAQVTRNQYQAGTVDYTSVSAAASTVYAAHADEIGNVVNRQAATVALIQAIGGQWSGPVDLHPSPLPPHP